MSRPLSEWNKFVQEHANDSDIRALPVRQRLAALSALRQQMHSSGFHTIVRSPKKQSSSKRGYSKYAGQRILGEHKSSPLSQLLSKAGSACSPLPERDCERHPACNWIQKKGHTPYCARTTSKSGKASRKKIEPKVKVGQVLAQLAQQDLYSDDELYSDFVKRNPDF